MSLQPSASGWRNAAVSRSAVSFKFCSVCVCNVRTERRAGESAVSFKFCIACIFTPWGVCVFAMFVCPREVLAQLLCLYLHSVGVCLRSVFRRKSLWFRASIAPSMCITVDWTGDLDILLKTSIEVFRAESESNLFSGTVH